MIAADLPLNMIMCQPKTDYLHFKHKTEDHTLLYINVKTRKRE